jgi:hypothetical protein
MLKLRRDLDQDKEINLKVQIAIEEDQSLITNQRSTTGSINE